MARGKQQRGGGIPRSPRRLTIECVTPELDAGRFAVKRVVGDRCIVSADIFKDGHDRLAARIRFRGPTDDHWRTTPLVYDEAGDRWSGEILFDTVGQWTFTVDAWTDAFGSWRDDLEKKFDAGQDIAPDLLDGARLIAQTARRIAFGDARTSLLARASALTDPSAPAEARFELAIAPELHALVDFHWIPDDITPYERELTIIVDRDRARFAAWYEMFPRSQTDDPARPGTFATAALTLGRIADLGFDVVYLPPIHPIGRAHRKGRNNALRAEPGDPGSPWAVGNEHGGHMATDPGLGTLEDFDRFVESARTLGLEVALDYALQCSPDHPWVKEHPEWFYVRPDGSVRYAENPPKKYQDIYPLNFWCESREALWTACRDILRFWIARGIRTFRVDNPHTKPFAFWEWLIADTRVDHPDVLFLSEAFTRPRTMKYLAKLGFAQSYTYFTWRNSAAELREYFTELTTPPLVEYFRGHLFTNTPDILHEYLQTGGPAAFRVRLVLAATLLPLYGIYSGFELFENAPLHAGSEEYHNAEKFEIRARRWDAEPNLHADLRRLNTIRREYAALQRADNLAFHGVDNARLLCFSKRAPDLADPDLLIVVNTDPHAPQEGFLEVPPQRFDIAPNAMYEVHDLLTGARYRWQGARHYVRLDPRSQPAHVFRVERI